MPDKDCYTLANGECVAQNCQLHGLLSTDVATTSFSLPSFKSTECPYCSENNPHLVAREECDVCGGTGVFYFSNRPIGKEN